MGKSKAEIRKEILRKLKAQGKKRKTEKDKSIKKRLLSLPEFKRGKIIAFYISFGGEVDTQALIDKALTAGKRVVVPVIVGDDLQFQEIENRKGGLKEGPYGILQPADSSVDPFPEKEIDAVIVPGLAFTKDGRRLGRGKGFYDRFLKTLPSRTKKIGLAYDFQIIKDLPTTPRDIPVDIVITN